MSRDEIYYILSSVDTSIYYQEKNDRYTIMPAQIHYANQIVIIYEKKKRKVFHARVNSIVCQYL